MFSTRTGWPRKTNRLHELAEIKRRAGELVDLTASNPTRCGFAYPERELLAALAQPAALRYEPQALGLEAARRAVSAYYAERGVGLPPERLVLTASTSEAYSHLFRLLCDPGDAAVMAAPSYPLFEMLAGIADVRLETAAMSYHGNGARGTWELEAGRLAAAGERTRALLLVHPNNPTGSYVKAAEWAAAQRLAAERGWAVIVDEVFFDYVVEGEAVRLELEEAPAPTFVLNGFSKIAGLPQMKLGWIGAFGPEAARREAMARLEILNDAYLSVDAPIQHAAAEVLRLRRGMQAQIRERVRGNLAGLDAALETVRAAERLRVEGGWNAVVRLPRLHSDEAWAERLVERTGVLTHPGHFYGFGLEGCLVVSLLPEARVFAEGMGRLLETAQRELE